MIDLALENALLVDGTGAPARPGGLGISGGRIVAVGDLAGTEARETVDLGGLALAPGFLDIHAHSDYMPLLDPAGHSRVRDGVTMEVTGNCGMSPFPLCDTEAHHEEEAHPGLEVDWRDAGPYLDRLRAVGMGLDRAYLVGHGTLRARVMGLADRKPTAGELEEMKALLATCLDAGAVGLSSGLIYAPGCYADVDELVALAEVVAAKGKLYASHIRGEGDTLLEAIDEVLEVAVRAKVRTQVSHLKASKPQNWHKQGEAIARIEAVREGGADVMADCYPYTATCTGLHAVLPESTLDGGKAAAARRCARGAPERAGLRAFLDGKHDRDYWGRVQLSSLGPGGDRSAEGRRVLEVAEERGLAPAELALDILAETGCHASAVYHVLDEANLRSVITRPWVMVGSDGSALACEGPAAAVRPHPRAFGTFARVLGRYVRDEGVLGLEEAVAKMTSMPADRLGLADRGRLAEGARADLVAFDPDRVADRATFEEPQAYSAGIHGVWIRGEAVVREGAHTGALPGEPVLT